MRRTALADRSTDKGDKMTNSEIKTGVGGTTFAGPDGVRLFQVMAISRGLRLYAETGMKPNRAWTPSAMLKAATSYTGKHYRRGEFIKAADDLKTWADTMAAALPITKGD
jgi:hypothetical protein